MRCFCIKSGISFFSDDTFQNEPEIPIEHPFFSLPPRSLLARARKWGQGKYSEKEEKLLFLALLNQTHSVEWEVPANPTPQTVKKYMESLFRLIDWYKDVDHQELPLPHLRISSYHSDLSNIGSFISAVYEVRKEWMEPARRRILDNLLMEKEQKLYRLIHSYKDTEKYAKQLTDYAMIAAKVPDEKKEDWSRILQTPHDHNVFTLDPHEIHLMINWFHKNLYKGSGSIHSAKLLEHVNKLYSMLQEGMFKYLGGIEERDDPRQSFQIKMDNLSSSGDIEAQKASLKELEEELSTSGAPEEEPVQKKYSSLLDWCKAMAKWRGTEGLRADIAFLKNKGL